jgi:hypothetical protein
LEADCLNAYYLYGEFLPIDAGKELNMKRAYYLAVILLTALVIFFTAAPTTRAAVTCFKTGEKTSGFNKICYYDCLGSEAAITIGATQLCPLTIQQ